MKSQLTSTPRPTARKEKLMKSLIPARRVLWFLFLFNATVAVAIVVAGHHIHVHGQTLHGTQQIATAAGMGIVALGAGIGLLQHRPVQH